MRRYALVLLYAGCYAPHAPSGSYACGAPSTDGGVGACPDNLSCVCGLCVSNAAEAACGFTVALKDPATTSFVEHQKFDVVVTAMQAADGGVASSFSGDVTLSSSWGDVCVGDQGCVGEPATVTLKAGTGSATIELNRETSPPQTAKISARVAATNVSGGSLAVSIAPSVIDAGKAQLVVPAVTNKAPFGWANDALGAPFVIATSSGVSLYFLGGNVGSRGIGYASSTDGVTFTPSMSPLVTSTDGLGAPGAFATSTGVSLFYGQTPNASNSKVGYETIARADAPTAAGPFSATPPALGGAPGFDSVDFPTVIADPYPAVTGGGADSAVMFFSGAALVKTGAYGISILRATATDGHTFVVDPGAALTNDADERTIVSPRLLLDGHVLKMWYSFTSTTAASALCSATYSTGYATSSDGYFWVRSPANLVAANGPGGGTLLVGSVIAADGVDPSNGVAIYYGNLASVLGSCVQNGISRLVIESGHP